MTITEKINEDLAEAMRSRDRLRVPVLRGLNTALLRLREDYTRSGGELTGNDEFRLLRNEVRIRKDLIEQYRRMGREDLVSDETANLAIIEAYLPELMSDDEIRERVRAVIAETGASDLRDLNLVISKTMATMHGRADNGRVNAIVFEELKKGWQP